MSEGCLLCLLGRAAEHLAVVAVLFGGQERIGRAGNASFAENIVDEKVFACSFSSRQSRDEEDEDEYRRRDCDQNQRCTPCPQRVPDVQSAPSIGLGSAEHPRLAARP